MINNSQIIFKLTIVIFYLSYTSGCDSHKQIYTEIGCKPIYDEKYTANKCPIAYDCESVFSRSINKCYFNGNVYEPSAKLSEKDSALSPCLASCTCNKVEYYNHSITHFVCANVECPSSFNIIEDNCYYQYEKDLCCEVNQICHGPNEKSKAYQCTYDGKTYNEGQRFYADNDWMECVCSPKFDGKIDNRFCRRVRCNYEILYMDNIKAKNAPVFFENTDSCPIEWLSSLYDTAKLENWNTKNSSGLKCSYGDTEVALGQKVTFDSHLNDDAYKTTCSCQVPPLVTCIKRRK
ncbi:uncharacterized protein LOC126903119 [Daktulosphaira vitifoliae]|uniref:uncharacterized protein LOC126903119 n=1 Tax=Daktulosphaira vitifoliae TaxID=58002 RepID=UPI0021AA7EBB|nr:uncharacterized protein LOC126903119 [Daktulosphaira vitifoliae]